MDPDEYLQILPILFTLVVVMVLVLVVTVVVLFCRRAATPVDPEAVHLAGKFALSVCYFFKGGCVSEKWCSSKGVIKFLTQVFKYGQENVSYLIEGALLPWH